MTWHEGTLVLSLWRGEMCTASFRMPMEDVGRLLDTLDEGFAEATGEQPELPEHDHDPGTEVMPGTGTYHRPPQHVQPQPVQPQPQLDERPTAALSPNDVLVARSTTPHQDKLVASYSETTGPRDPYGESASPSTGSREATPAYGDQRSPFTGPQYIESTGPQPKYTGDPFSGPQYTADPLSGPHYTQPAAQPDPFTGPQYVDNEPVYQLPGDQRRPSPLSTDPLGFPSQASEPYQGAAQQPYPPDPYPSDPYGGRHSDGYQQAQPQPSAAGLGTPMHGIPGAGRRRQAPQQAQPARDDYGSYQQQSPQPNPVDPLLALGRPEQYPPQDQYQQQEPYQPRDPYQAQEQYPPQDQYQQPDADMSRPYVGDPMFSTGERLRPEQPDYHERSDRREW
ncbi:hypothetical protein [Nonomuraea candida]|uniref:hypothetical protein n=1 Tax=Nonomuraea candida TaxID=359159 RepID=UPI0005BCFB29|nr:hypothetical protein [Nonomuraea candida]